MIVVIEGNKMELSCAKRLVAILRKQNCCSPMREGLEGARSAPAGPERQRSPGKPGWSYFCPRYADTKILLAHATWVPACGGNAPKFLFIICCLLTPPG
jgi:hypothetical protein